MDLIGRDHAMHALWRQPDETSVLLTGPHGIRETTWLRALHATDHAGWDGVFVDVQGASTVGHLLERFTAAMRLEVRAEAEMTSKAMGAPGAALGLSPEASHDAWREVEVLPKTLLAWRDPKHRGLPLLDEVPWWLDARERAEPNSTGAALANLRRLRGQFGERPRRVCRGSVGLAGPASDLGTSAEVDDVRVVDVPPLDGAAWLSLRWRVFSNLPLDRFLSIYRYATYQ